MTDIREPRNIPRGITLVPPGTPEFGDLVAAMGLPTPTPGRAALLQYDLRHRVLRWILLLPSAAMLLSAYAVGAEMRMEWWVMLISIGAILWISLLCLWLFNRWGKDVRWYLLEPDHVQAVLPGDKRVRLVSDEGDKARAEWFREFLAAWLSLP